MKILFLDFDGVISTNRAWLANEHIDDFYLRWIDPIAVAMLTKLCQKFKYQIVVTSTWRKFGKENCVLAMGTLAQFLHEDWRTIDAWAMGEDSKGSRSKEITDWLVRNSAEDYIIVDDDYFDWTDEQAGKWVKTDTTNGFSTENYETVLVINETSELGMPF